ncbi:MAG TPA: AAA family ATPase, partial [Candidatus Lokiarchaeia archaeon]
MKIQQVEIQNFRSIKSVKFNLLPYMVFVGKNNSGKSNLMIALDAFFSSSVGADDFRKEKGATSKNILIAVTFYQLNKKEKELYSGKLLDEGETHERLILRFSASLSNDSNIEYKYEYFSQTINLESSENQKRYGPILNEEIYKSVSKILEHEHIPQDFKDKIKNLVDSKGTKRLVKQEFIELRDDYQKNLLIKHPSLAKQEFREIKINSKNIKSMLGNFFFVPAVQDIEKETKYTAKDNKNLNHLMNYVLDQMQDTGQRRKKEQELQRLLKDLYRLEEKGSEINNLMQLLNSQLKNFDDSLLTFDTKLPNLSKMIRDSLKIYIDDGVRTEVQYKGHGLQRYFMVILFKVWSEKLMENKSKETDAECTSTYFAIEEPELFLHPQYQRMMRIYLQNISENEGHQIILNTHSPHFIEFNNIFQVAKV